ncbi:universal stress protein [Nocardia cyriacigeorgica]|uniref:Universal stress protein n=1 Tax=Nocardia cyriacigeorgica TaxID=135487 RepID=A0A6P1D3R0_9NOCA|nr:universal stress protein [Nocardia cyriacigeorgica]NEW43780.1 universal stress protein [Nocardia cyriacigeorgica]
MSEQSVEHSAGDVIVGIDGSAGSLTAARWAAGFATERGRALRLAHGMELVGTAKLVSTSGGVTSSLLEALKENSRHLLDRAEEAVTAETPDLAVSTRVSVGSAAALLIEESAGAYTVILGATGNVGVLGHIGSTLLTVVSRAHGPVIVVRTDAEGAIRSTGPVVVGVDGSPVSEAALATAFTEAAVRRTDLVAIHVHYDRRLESERLRKFLPEIEVENAGQEVLGERLAGWQEEFPDVTVLRKTYSDNPTARLREWSDSAQLVVVGSRGRGGFTGLLLGSTSHSLVQHAGCPVMVVRPENSTEGRDR